RLSPERGRAGLLRQAEIHLEGLRIVRLRVLGLPRGGPRQARSARQRGPGGRAVADRPPRRGARQGKALGREDERNHPPPDVRGGDPGGARVEDHRARAGLGDPQERAREVLRWRHHEEAQAPREAEGGQEAHEEGRPRGHPPGGVSRRVEGRMKKAPSGASAADARTAETTPPQNPVHSTHSTAREWYESLLVAG